MNVFLTCDVQDARCITEQQNFTLTNYHNCSGLQRSPSKRKVGSSNPSRKIPKSQKQVVTAPLLNAQKYV